MTVKDILVSPSAFIGACIVGYLTSGILSDNESESRRSQVLMTHMLRAVDLSQ